jgi:hypothetical protein
MFQIKVVEEIKTHILRSVIFFSENRAVYEITSKNVEPERTQKIWRQRVTYWISKQAHARVCAPPPPTHTHTDK